MTLITVEKLKTKLLTSKKYDSESIPTNEVLSLFIEIVNELIIDWLGYNPENQLYEEKLKSNDRYLIQLSYYPVQQVESVDILLPEQPPTPLTLHEGTGLWYGKHTIRVPYKNVLAKITYWAGFDPLPQLFEITIFIIIDYLLSINNSYPDISALNKPTKDISSLSLPGGLSRSYKYGNTKSSNSSYAGTEFERLMTPLKRYRRQYRF